MTGVSPKHCPVNRHGNRRLLRLATGCLLLTQFAAVAVSWDKGDRDRGTRANRLARETSPYLLAHARNPVDWYPWGAEAFAKAKAENRPIFLSIGYSSCHWCHVMERKVFSDPEIARSMNENFVCIKVDREERPDIDDVYMTALQMYYQAIGSPQSGGWPLSLFLTPDGRPLGGGTYFPPTSDEGNVSFPDLIRNVIASWSDPAKRNQLNANADLLTESVRNAFRAPPRLGADQPDAALVARVLTGLEQTFDTEYGGFGFSSRAPNRPKFPVPPKLAFLQGQLTEDTGPKSAAGMLNLTLDRMAAGGIYDHVGGGFHRYSTDRFWRVPHFEKMLYDNAQLASLYTEAYARTRKPRYRDVAEGTLDFVLRELADPQGGFYTALDADSEGVEGRYYVWTTEQLQELLTAEELGICQQVYGTAGRPNFEEGHVLQLLVPIEESAEKLGMSLDTLEERLAEIRRKLLRERVRRPSPPRDDKILCGWNGLMIAALARASVVFERPEYLRAARVCAEFLVRELRQSNGRLYRSYCAREARIEAYLEDYALLVHGLLALEEATEDPKWGDAARRLTDLQLELFWDERSAGCFATNDQHEQLLVRTKPPYDSVMPSGNSATVRNLLSIAKLSGEQKYRSKAQATLEHFAPQMASAPTSMANMALALAESLPADDRRQSRKVRNVVSPEALGPAGELEDRGEIRQTQGESVAPRNDAVKRKKPEKVTVRAFLSADPLPPGKTCKILVELTIEKGWHIHANPAGDPEGDVQTEVGIHSELGIELAEIRYPPGRKVSRSEGPAARYWEGTVQIQGILEIPAGAAGQSEELTVEVMQQPCNDSSCLVAKKIKVSIPVEVAKRAADARAANERLFQTPPAAKPERTPGKSRRS